MMKVKLSKLQIFLVVVALAALIFVIWVAASRPGSRTVEEKEYHAKEIKGSYQETKNDGDPVKVADDGEKVLYYDQTCGGVIYEDKKTGEKVYSVPVNSQEDPKATGGDTKKEIGSAILLTYYDIKTQKTVVFDSLTNAVALNQVYYAPLKDRSGVAVKMILGREDAARLIPEQISEGRFEKVLEEIEEASGASNAKKVKALYLHYTKDKATADQMQKFPALQKTNIYVLKSSVTKKNKEDLEKYFSECGYTYEQMEKDYEELEYVSEAEQFPCFKVYMECYLEDGALKVNLPAGDIEYDRNAFILTQVRVFPFMGAGKTGEDGYVFIPDGSGALVPFNNDGRITSVFTANRTYGPDATEPKVDRGSSFYEYRNPVFGIKAGNHALFGIVTDGDATTQICNQVGNIIHSYNTAYAMFTVSQSAQYESYTAEQAPWVQYDRKGYTKTISLSYWLLTGADADYVGMAKTYRNYILSGRKDKKEASSCFPIIIETLGTVGNNTRVLGIPGYRNVEVTSFDEASDMLNELTQMGVSGIKLRYLAWCNNGYYTDVPTKLEIEDKVGSKGDLKKLIKAADKVDAELFMDINVLTSYFAVKNGFDPAFIKSKDGIRDLFQRQAYYPFSNPTTGEFKSWLFCMNPKKVMSYFDRMTGKYDKLGLSSLSIGTMGTVLNSNYKRSDYTNRQESLRISEEIMNKASEKYNSIMIEGGNAYTLSDADYIVSLPMSGSGYMIETESVPFIQIALHGIVNYAGEPLNNSVDYEKDILKYIEYGCIPYFSVCDADGSILKKSFIVEKELFDVDYDKWKEQIVSTYKKMSNVLEPVRDAYIIDHKELSDGVYATAYDNGYTVYVNYNDESAAIMDNVIPAKDCIIVKGGR